MDAFVFPSETDTFGLAVLEALASGVPAIVSSSGGPRFTVEHGKSGYVPTTSNEFAQLLAKLMNEPEVRESMRIEARHRALAMASWDEIFASMYQTYERYARTESAAESILLEDATKAVNT